ncbi:phosphate signaling complex protein PhoU [Aestuariicoccus sp. MJ-SS9]|uniref:phosphate signaling complex protein PhoU n=1 Tax=Aestuariicoccus sp. MJ-SS9 TaxID=3079855 RepID=UPI00290E8C4A|nr:phosphate signaling complex protein PhoU [Aestuariicoccus sp. MJ-SS9]MDU8912093.1 phosphate signaling complex protein PhoU [Aestuariicoccus sp. MJ-SS9]
MHEMKQHIASAFDRDLEGIQARIMKMGGLVETAIRDSAKSLETRDEQLAELVRANDKLIDALEEQLNEEAARVIALRAPTAGDLRVVLSVMRMSANLERIGDLAKNMAKRTGVLVHLQPIGGTSTALRRMAREVELMLKDALDSYIQRDEALAADVIARDSDVDQMYNTVFREFLTFMLEDPRNITACMHLHFIAKNIERMGDHVTSIAEQVVFLTTGHKPDEARIKADVTSTDPELSLESDAAQGKE